MAENRYAKYRQSGVVASMPGSGPKPPSGYGLPGAPAITPLPGGPDDPATIARIENLKAGIGAGKEMGVANYRNRLDLNADAVKKARELALEREKAKLPKVSPEVRAEAIKAYVASQRMNNTIGLLNKRYAEGPGATKGIAGIKDFLPSEANSRFDTLANTMRGDVGTALGFTGGQLNTEKEAERNVGSFIPNSGNLSNMFDATAKDKIEYLRGLADMARKRSIAVLGGVPDRNGVVTPLPRQTAPRAVPKGAAPRQQSRVIEFNDLPE